MENSEILAGIRYALHLKNSEVLEMITLGGGTITIQDVAKTLKAEDHPEYLPCTAEWLHQFFDGLIITRRGPRDGNSPVINIRRIDNNMVLRKIRIAFELKDTDIVDICRTVGFSVTKGELGAMARKKDHEKYMKCGDQLMRYLLRGLAKRFRPDGIDKPS